MFDSHRQFKFGSKEYIAAIDNDIKNIRMFKNIILPVIALAFVIVVIFSMR